MIIPKSIRDLVGIKEGDTLIIKVENGDYIRAGEKS
ncbi:AbrB/MazE/SpoVT family DNA-binding domain-containing protein [Sulfurisphaera ohwakuensis]